MTDPRKLIASVRALRASICGDHSCVFGPVSGMGTNGGCRCFTDIDTIRRREIERTVRLLDHHCTALSDALSAALDRAERAEAFIRHARELSRDRTLVILDDDGLQPPFAIEVRDHRRYDG